MSSIEIGRSDLADVDRRLRRFVGQMTDLRPFWPRVSDLFVDWMGEQFESEGGWGGNEWAQLSEAYAARKMRLKPGKGILVFDGDLKKAAQSPRRTALPQSLKLTIDSELAEWHSSGAGNLPARPVLPDRLPESARRELERELRDYAQEVARREGLA